MDDGCYAAVCLPHCRSTVRLAVMVSVDCDSSEVEVTSSDFCYEDLFSFDVTSECSYVERGCVLMLAYELWEDLAVTWADVAFGVWFDLCPTLSDSGVVVNADVWCGRC